ncbi:hypothetical protein EVAR_37323_1 [Eumeta japonica]|uniref:Uncharacterized protein n=1 Tax=Eumeta variegata TaxID=151549 RepID=A0A4C1WXR2_EUMVA|nr:hypothetical protein EVAR_37323_1 [Eumeta japonica]
MWRIFYKKRIDKYKSKENSVRPVTVVQSAAVGRSEYSAQSVRGTLRCNGFIAPERTTARVYLYHCGGSSGERQRLARSSTEAV